MQQADNSLSGGCRSVRSGSGPAVLALASVLLLGACEARLDLSGVEQTLNQAVRRTDQLMVLERVGEQLIVLGNDGLLLRRGAASELWQRQQLERDGVHPDFIAGALCGDGSLVALSYQAEVWQTHDGGDSWHIESLPTEEDVQDIECTADNQLWVVGSYSTLLHRAAAGSEWQQSSLQEDAMLTAVTFASIEHGYAAGEFGLLAVTEDGGANWRVVDPIGEELYPLAVYFDAEDNGWVGGLQGVIMHSEDGGKSWQRTETPTESPIYNFLMVGERLLATGDQGTVLQWLNGRWQRVETPETPTYFRAGIAVSPHQALIAGGWGALLSISLASQQHSVD